MISLKEFISKEKALMGGIAFPRVLYKRGDEIRSATLISLSEKAWAIKEGWIPVECVDSLKESDRLMGMKSLFSPVGKISVFLGSKAQAKTTIGIGGGSLSSTAVGRGLLWKYKDGYGKPERGIVKTRGHRAASDEQVSVEVQVGDLIWEVRSGRSRAEIFAAMKVYEVTDLEPTGNGDEVAIICQPAALPSDCLQDIPVSTLLLYHNQDGCPFVEKST